MLIPIYRNFRFQLIFASLLTGRECVSMSYATLLPFRGAPISPFVWAAGAPGVLGRGRDFGYWGSARSAALRPTSDSVSRTMSPKL